MATFVVVFVITLVVLTAAKIIKKGGQPDKENSPGHVQAFVNTKPFNSTVAKSTIPTASSTPIDLTSMKQVCMEAGDEGDIDFYLVSDSVYQKITDTGPTPSWVEKNPPVKIEYTDNKGNKTIRDITPLRINGGIMNEETYDLEFGIDAYCHLRKEERSFWTSKISAAWRQGEEINLGDYLAKLCKKNPEYKDAIK
jgi:hypothetical protein